MRSNNKQKVLFLYSELAQYFISCINNLARNHNYDIHVVRWQVNEDAPFNFEIEDDVSIYERSEFGFTELLEFAKELDPTLIFCSGWMDKDYVRVCKKFNDDIPVIVGLDNQWKGTIKQRLASLMSRWTVRNWFNYAWVAGSQQKEYALRLGFKEENILTGVYSADYENFRRQSKAAVKNHETALPHRFLYVGRYIERKGIIDLWEAFKELVEETGTDWELWCCGTGPLQDQAISHPQVKHLGFVQPQEMEEIIKNTSVFVLPSHAEPWGVVVHEFAAAGFPLICSSRVGAASQFLIEGENGFVCKAGNVKSIKKTLKNIIAKGDTELFEMGKISAKLASENTPSIWANKLADIIEINKGM